jgi:diadenosine tetraphosphate (Ap4A) HIT family hydrolase
MIDEISAGPCIFCAIAAGTAPAHVVYEDDAGTGRTPHRQLVHPAEAYVRSVSYDEDVFVTVKP